MLLYFDHVPFICFLYPFGGLLHDGLLGLPLDSFSVGSCDELLNIGILHSHHVYTSLLIIGHDRALATIVTFSEKAEFVLSRIDTHIHIHMSSTYKEENDLVYIC